MKEFNSKKARKAQKKYQEENKMPDFAPVNGNCWGCHRDIYTEIEHPEGHKTGISVEEASNSLITGCPHCNKTYCG